MKYLIVKPMGGLANRMRVIESAYNYAKKHEAELIFLWEKNDILNARYSDCFNPTPGAKVIEVDYSGSSVSDKLRRKMLDAAKWLGLSAYAQKDYDDTKIEGLLTDGLPNERSNHFFDTLATSNKGVFLETCFEFYPNLYGFRVQIHDEIKAAALQNLKKYPSLVGVHVRLTDHVFQHRSPQEKYIDEIKNNLAVAPDDFYYLSTDSDDVVANFKALFNDKIITGVSIRNRNSKEGIIAALMELCCLSECKLILGSYKSSFSERAAIMGNKPLKVLVN